jgi:glycosyltransferase involved in cell wall biosynthesis
MPRKPVVLFQWKQSAPYLVDRLEATRRAGVTPLEIVNVSDAATSYEWPFDPTASQTVINHVLFTDRKFEETSFAGRLVRRLKVLRQYKVQSAFLCHHDHLDTFIAAIIMRLMGIRVYLMLSSKFDDKPRQVWREALKSLFVVPYQAVLCGGRRQREYAEFLGVPASKVFEGYETVSVDRIRAQAGVAPAPGGTPYHQRHFTIIARHVPKKNLFMAIDAYDRYRRAAGNDVRDLHLCGSGELEPQLRAEVAKRGLAGVSFLGFLPPEAVARELGTTLAVILPSTEEQWGLAVNEALAMGIPVLCSDNVGARDGLVRSSVNGYVFEPDNPEGLARLMGRVAQDEAEWRRLALAALEFAPKADVGAFAQGVAQALAV